jgi:hypothetical protein
MTLVGLALTLVTIVTKKCLSHNLEDWAALKSMLVVSRFWKVPKLLQTGKVSVGLYLVSQPFHRENAEHPLLDICCNISVPSPI